jgi:DNA-binding NtrC family response regulator
MLREGGAMSLRTKHSSAEGAEGQDGHRVLVVDDDPIAGESIAEYLREQGYVARWCVSGDDALKLLQSSEQELDARAGFAVAICDVAMPGMNGMELLRRIVREHPTTAVIMLSGYGTVESAVASLRSGAIDYLTKPVIDAELQASVERGVRHHALLAENRQLRSRLEGKDESLAGLVGSHASMRKVYELVEAVAPSRTTVLMTGESGVGKSLIASMIHQLSPRRSGPLVQLSCGSIPETLLESELFGHVKGSFTGAHADKIGRFLAANGGTIFLDEINSASPAMQLKLLRVLQERKFEPVGSTQTIEVDVRVILASNRPLEELVARGEFRADLYYRINVLTIDVPPLRERPTDIPSLAMHFLRRHERDLGRTFVGFSPDALDALLRYRFPGNVRELENIVERAAVLSRTPTIGIDALPEHMKVPPEGSVHTLTLASSAEDRPIANDAAWSPIALEEALREPERRIILRALKANGWNRQKTADDLKINRTTLYKKMRLLGIESEGDERLAG